tara:strand:- start:1049 stop:1339 length:291 start_codon:yes stop_codon:yes gene_type:complete
MLTSGMVGGSYKFSDLLKKKKRTKKKKKKEKSDKRSKGDPSKLGYPAKKTNLNIIIKGSDGNLYKNKKYKKTKRWVKVRARERAKVRAHAKKSKSK